MPHLQAAQQQQQQPQQMQHDDLDTDPEDIEDVVGESDQESDAEEDLLLELDDGRNANKVRGFESSKNLKRFNFFFLNSRKMKWKWNTWQP
jgi:hypothetical protein